MKQIRITNLSLAFYINMILGISLLQYTYITWFMNYLFDTEKKIHFLTIIFLMSSLKSQLK